MFDLQKIKTRTDLAFLDYHPQLSSTNDRGIELVKQNAIIYPALVLTENQTVGRGQHQRRWESSAGSLTFSWIISHAGWPVETESSISLIPVTVALAVARAIEDATQLTNIKIKWPNDLIVVDRKISGILIETLSIESERIFVIGIGINVNNQDISSLLGARPNDGSPTTPTSVWLETQRETSVDDLLIAIIQQLETEFACLQSQPALILEGCNQRLFRKDEEIRVTRPGEKEQRGICQGISPDGSLVLKTVNGTEVIFSGTIKAV